MRLGSGLGLSKPSGTSLTYIKDGLKLYMPYKGADTTKGTQFVGTGSTSFDGSNDYIDCGSDSTLDVGTSDFSVSAWFKVSTKGGTDYHDIVAKGHTLGAGNGWGICLVEYNMTIYFDTNGDVGRQNAISPSDSWEFDKWYHIVGTRSNSADTLKLYLNGALIQTQASATNDDLGDTSINFGIGKGVSGRITNGNIKNVGFWSRVLTPTEIQNVMYKTYAEVSGRLASGLVSWWGLDVDYTDSHGDNDGTNSGSTLDTDLYGGDTPVIPRAIDNAPTVQADAIGSGSALFDGTDDYINAGELSDALKNKADMSISVWIYPTHSASGGDTYHTIASQWDGSGSDCWGLWLRAPNNATTSFIRYDNTMSNVVEDGTAIVEVNKWSHIAVSKDGTTTKLYHNGVEVHSGTSDAATGNQTEELLIAAQNKSSPTAIFKGNISQLGLWDAVLTQAQIQSVMEKTYEELDASEKEDLVSYWALDVDGSDSHGDNDGTLT